MANDERALPSRQRALSPDKDGVLSDSATLFSESSQGPSSDAGRFKQDEERKSIFSFRRSLTSVWSNRHPSATTLDETRGPLGLRLLASSPEPLIDLIFVHGLRGGSIRTWQKEPDPQYFWPKYWLPLEPEFSHANIHSFGIKCIFFLATPHRGSDYAAILNRILRVTEMTGLSTAREYVKDLTAGSTSTQLINDEFGKFAHELAIYSFYETLETKIGVSSALIVDKTSAVLAVVKNENDSQEQLRVVKSLLKPAPSLEEHHERLAGSCTWIEERQDFLDWRDSDVDFHEGRDYPPSIYWVTANPGVGKTILASHVTSQLKELCVQNSVHFFRFGKKESHSLATCLRAIAYQMATTNAAVRGALAELYRNDCTFDQDDARAVWLKIFTSCIFQVAMFAPYYWVLDAVDECVKYVDFFALLRGVKPRFPLRIFITSRNLPETQKIMRYLGDCEIVTVEIPITNTMNDIDLFVQNRMKDFPMDSGTEKDDLARQILEKSGGSFLWVRLVMDELECVNGYESMLEIIQGIPEGMIGYYARATSDMAANKREKHIAQAILLWVALAARPLTVFELSHALELDINVRFPSAKSAIEGLCGNLVCVDKATDIAHIIHSTAREFLLTEDAGEFQIRRSKGHERIALVCLRLLVGPQMQPPRNRRLHRQKQPQRLPPPLLDYAMTQFSEHVYWASAESDELLTALNRFLTTTVLSWVEKVVGKKDLYRLIRTAKNLKAYLDRRGKYRSPLNQHVQRIDSWATDISRLATKFGRALVSSPSAIYFLIPPLCPAQSAIYQQFGRTHDGLLVSGNLTQQWDDCISTTTFENEAGAAVAAGNNLIAVGFESGNIQLFNHRSCQKVQAIKQDSWVDRLYFDPLGTYLVSCSRKFIFLWDLDGKMRWKARIRAQCLLLASSPGYLFAVTHQGYSFKWDIITGEMLEKQSYRYRPPPNSETNIHSSKAPFAASISPGLELLGLAYRNSPVCLFDFASGEFVGWAIDERSRAASQLIFNPDPDVGLLLIAYNESHLALYDSWSGALIHSREPDQNAVFNAVSCSPDGRTFATVDILGNLRLWDFESLTILYHVLTPGHTFRLLHFTSDGFNLVDIDDDEMRVWSPSALVRKTVEEEASTSDQAAVLPVMEGQFEMFRSSKISTVAAHSVVPFVLAGNQDGDVLLYSSNDGHLLESVYSHGAFITGIALTNGKTIASSDINNVVQVWELDLDEGRATKTRQLKFQVHLGVPVVQIMFDAAGEYLLISTATGDRTYSANDGSLVGDLTFTPERRMWRWAPLPSSFYPERFALLADGKLTTYSIENISSKTNSRELLLNYAAEPDSVVEGLQSLILAVEKEKRMALLTIKQRHGQFTSTLTCLVFQLSGIGEWDQDGAVSPSRTLPSSVCKQFLDLRRSNNDILFLHQNQWITSTDLTATNEQYTRHFIVPTDFVAGSLDIVPVQTADEGFTFCVRDKLTIVKNGMTFAEPQTAE
ncbi:hypothetical protein SAPIO_CDS6124 [Scedosporium apiospermum]|uniref:Uncharacterized protein n=1 Tax=Pseudallescheria apiosperma TaxID=563466 RepID=A0A084G4K3_PSEDA|nr:uncharacterized protein SAPIO_CDS6124 [Scedosporium apiospermum]KEZ42265.1 hypothetical protein SAPIO_CDS6124 [Scedosporium apiospermum]